MNSKFLSVIDGGLTHVYAMFEEHPEMQKWFQDMSVAVCLDLKNISSDQALFPRIIAEKGANCFEANLNAVLGQVRALDPEFKIECRKGCSFCCYYHLTLMPQEAFNIALYLAEHLNADEFEAVRTLCVDFSMDYDSEGLHSFAKKYFQKCPFLKDNECSIYEVRPIVCRNWVSHDLESCIASYESENKVVVPQNAVVMIQKDLVFAGQHAFLDMLGINGRIASFLPLMAQIMSDYEGIYARWISGETLRGQLEGD